MNFGVLAQLDLWFPHLSETVALALVALLGYLFGHRTRSTLSAVDESRANHELQRAKHVAKELEGIAETVRRDLAVHRASVTNFKDRVQKLSGGDDEQTWQQLCSEAEAVLQPTLKLAMQMSLAYDEIRQQSNQLMTFTEVRTDSLTGVCNRRALEDALENMFAIFSRFDRPFSVAIFDIDHFKQINQHQGHLHGDTTLQKFAKLLDESARDGDLVARYGGEEFVVVMPHTPLSGACTFADRFRQNVDQSLPITISVGIAQAQVGDTSQSLISRADSALYSAKAAGRNCVFRHDGTAIEPAVLSQAEPAESPAEPPQLSVTAS